MDDKTKEQITSNALERADLRLKLKLWEYFSTIEGFCESLKDNDMRRHAMLMALLEDISHEAWRLGRDKGYESAINERQT